MTDEERKAGVVCYSAGNHSQAVAYAATLLGIESWVVMPETASTVKVAACQSYGGHVVLHGNTGSEAYEKAIEIMNEKKLVYIDPVEPSGGASVAGLLSKRAIYGKKNVCILSGRNVNTKVLAELLSKN